MSSGFFYNLKVQVILWTTIDYGRVSYIKELRKEAVSDELINKKKSLALFDNSLTISSAIIISPFCAGKPPTDRPSEWMNGESKFDWPWMIYGTTGEKFVIYWKSVEKFQHQQMIDQVVMEQHFVKILSSLGANVCAKGTIL